MSRVEKPADAQAGARKAKHVARVWPTFRILLVGGLCLLGLLLWSPSFSGYRVLLPTFMATATMPGSGIKYGVEAMPGSLLSTENRRVLYQAVDPLGLLWHEVSAPRLVLAHSYNNYHPGVQLVPAPDGRKLFVKRGMGGRGSDTVWSDCIDVASEQIRSCGGVGDCCMSGEPEMTGVTDRTGARRDSEKVEAMARAAGIVD